MSDQEIETKHVAPEEPTNKTLDGDATKEEISDASEQKTADEKVEKIAINITLKSVEEPIKHDDTKDLNTQQAEESSADAQSAPETPVYHPEDEPLELVEEDDKEGNNSRQAGNLDVEDLSHDNDQENLTDEDNEVEEYQTKFWRKAGIMAGIMAITASGIYYFNILEKLNCHHFV